jgi:hypothetical protein
MKSIRLCSIILCCTLTLCSCDRRPRLISDGITLSNFQLNQAKLNFLVSKCFKFTVKKSSQEICSDESTKLTEIKVKDIRVRHQGELLFVVDRYVDKSLFHTLVYEKGYAYTPKRTKGNLVKATLDDFPSKRITEKADKETWLYREIEPNWYVYYRYFYNYTDNITEEYEGE